jgi:hypothetical protein
VPPLFYFKGKTVSRLHSTMGRINWLKMEPINVLINLISRCVPRNSKKESLKR